MIETRSQTWGEDSKGATIRSSPEESGHATHVGLAPRTFCLPVDDAHLPAVEENGALWEMEFRIRLGRYSRVGPRHPWVSVFIGIEEHCPLSQKCISFTKGVFNGPVHSESELSLPARDIDSFLLARYFIKYGSNLNRAVRNRKAQLNPASGEGLSGQDSHRSYNPRKEKSFHLVLLKKDRTNTSPQVR